METPRLILLRALADKGWKRSQLIASLQRAGCKASRQKVGGWLAPIAASNPDAAILGALCDVLGLTPERSADLYAACGCVLPVNVRALIDGPVK